MFVVKINNFVIRTRPGSATNNDTYLYEDRVTLHNPSAQYTSSLHTTQVIVNKTNVVIKRTENLTTKENTYPQSFLVNKKYVITLSSRWYLTTDSSGFKHMDVVETLFVNNKKLGGTPVFTSFLNTLVAGTSFKIGNLTTYPSTVVDSDLPKFQILDFIVFENEVNESMILRINKYLMKKLNIAAN